MDDTPGVLAGECQLGTLNIAPEHMPPGEEEGAGRSLRRVAAPRRSRCGSLRLTGRPRKRVGAQTPPYVPPGPPPHPPQTSARSGKPCGHGC